MPTVELTAEEMKLITEKRAAAKSKAQIVFEYIRNKTIERNKQMHDKWSARSQMIHALRDEMWRLGKTNHFTANTHCSPFKLEPFDMQKWLKDNLDYTCRQLEAQIKYTSEKEQAALALEVMALFNANPFNEGTVRTIDGKVSTRWNYQGDFQCDVVLTGDVQWRKGSQPFVFIDTTDNTYEMSYDLYNLAGMRRTRYKNPATVVSRIIEAIVGRRREQEVQKVRDDAAAREKQLDQLVAVWAPSCGLTVQQKMSYDHYSVVKLGKGVSVTLQDARFNEDGSLADVNVSISLSSKRYNLSQLGELVQNLKPFNVTD